MLKALLVVVENVGVFVEEFDGDGEEVVKVHGTRYLEASLIFDVGFRDFAVEDIFGAVEGVVG